MEDILGNAVLQDLTPSFDPIFALTPSLLAYAGTMGSIRGPRIATKGPMRGAEQRSKRGSSPRGLSEGEPKLNRKHGQAPRARVPQRPAFESSAGNRVAATNLGSPFLGLLSFGEAKESD